MSTFRIGPPPAPPPPKKPLQTLPEFELPFDKLLGCKWRDVDFPIVSASISFAHDLVPHEYVLVDGANVENTGRGPMKITFKIPFFNFIVPAKTEAWKSGTLYPDKYREFLLAFAETSLGTLIHPALGEVRCRPGTYEDEHSPEHRDGVIVTVSFLETTEDTFAIKSLIGNDPQSDAKVAGASLDASNRDLRGLVDKYLPPAFEETFESLVSKVTGLGDQLTVSAQLLSNKPGQILSHVKQLENSAAKAKSALAWPVTNTCTDLKNAIFDLQVSMTATKQKKVLRYTVLADTTLAGISAATGASVDELLALNPQLARSPSVNAGMVVRHYAR